MLGQTIRCQGRGCELGPDFLSFIFFGQDSTCEIDIAVREKWPIVI